MAGKLFIGFDINRASNTLMAYNTTNYYIGFVVWPAMSLPPGVYHHNGAATQSIDIYPPNANTSAQYLACAPPGGSVGMAWGCNGSTAWSASSPTRASYQTAKGLGLGIVRSVAGLGTASELFITFDATTAGFGTGDKTTGHEPTDAWNHLFQWGDVVVRIKSHTANGTVATTIFSVRNNGSEVATTTLTGYAQSAWLFCKLRVKLDASTGAIDFTVNGQAQSTPVTGINTVTTTSLVSATTIYMSPPVVDSSTVIYVGGIDNIYIDDAAFPSGRPATSSFTVLSDSTLTNSAAFGTGATTVTDALSNPADAKAWRTTSAGGSAVLNITPPTTTLFSTDIVGVVILAQGAANRSGTTDRRITLGYDLSGTETFGDIGKLVPLIYDYSVLPPTPASQSRHIEEQVFTKSSGGLLSKTELASIKLLLKSTSP